MPHKGLLGARSIAALVVAAALSGCGSDVAHEGKPASSPPASAGEPTLRSQPNEMPTLQRRRTSEPTLPGSGEQAQSDAALRMVNALAARGDAESLVDAVLLLSLACGPEGCAGQDEARQQWLAAAARQAPEHPLVALLQIQECRTGSCADVHARFAALDPDNAYAHVVALGGAASAADPTAADRALRNAAEAKVFDSYYPELTAAYAQALGRLPPPTAASREQFGRNLGLHDTPDEDDMRLMQAMASVASVATPRLQALMQTCSVGSLRHAEARRVACIGALAHLANADTALARSAGLARLVELTAHTEAARQWRERLREFAWVQSQYIALQASMGPAERRVQAEQGEWLAMQALLRRLGVPLLPPPGWLPERWHHRDLIAGGG